MSEITTTQPPAYADTRWPWRLIATRTDGTTHERDYAADFEPVGFAQKLSQNPDIARVEVSTAFVNGQQVAPPETPESETSHA